MQDTISVKLPFSGKEVLIRNYTTSKDDNIADSIMYRNVHATGTGDSKSISMPISDVLESETSYVNRLVISIDGSIDKIAENLEELRSQDYKAISDKVAEVVSENSPKAKAVQKS